MGAQICQRRDNASGRSPSGIRFSARPSGGPPLGKSGVTATTAAPQLSARRRACSTTDLSAAAQSTFGGFGFAVLAVGGLFTAWLVVSRLFFGVPLVDRPALVLTTLMIVLGIQIISVGLIGEIVAFTYAKDIKDYRVDRVVGPSEMEQAAREPAPTAAHEA